MKDYWKKNNSASFAFYAVPRDWKEELLNEKSLSEEKLEKFIDKYKKVRFNIYDYAMVNLFSPEDFTHLRDTKNCIYILLNKNQENPKETIKSLGEYLLAHSDLIFEVDGA